MEAVIGALFLDGGLPVAKRYIDDYILTNTESLEKYRDSKSQLQELAQSMKHKEIRYEICGEDGPEHDKIFKVRVYVADKIMGEGTGKTKKAAEQSAAYQAILVLRDSK